MFLKMQSLNVFSVTVREGSNVKIIGKHLSVARNRFHRSESLTLSKRKRGPNVSLYNQSQREIQARETNL